jgi:predicted Rossmann-fold nucleotide-binding protein
MAALNDGAALGNGHIVGVIHEMWLDEGEDSSRSSATLEKADENKKRRALRDGGAHAVFNSSTTSNAPASQQQHGGPHPALSNGGKERDSSAASASSPAAPIREMLVARGKDLQERKRLLVEGSDGLVVLPGGPGTWDELWEMACARNIGLADLPIVCVNTDGYYDGFRAMLERAHADGLTKLRPGDILHFEDGPEGAVRWIEEQCREKARAGEGGRAAGAVVSPQQRAKVLRSSSVLAPPAASLSWFSSALVRRASSWMSSEPPAPTSSSSPRSNVKDGEDGGDDDEFDLPPGRALLLCVLPIAIWFGAGVAVGSALSSSPRRNR